MSFKNRCILPTHALSLPIYLKYYSPQWEEAWACCSILFPKCSLATRKEVLSRKRVLGLKDAELTEVKTAKQDQGEGSLKHMLHAAPYQHLHRGYIGGGQGPLSLSIWKNGILSIKGINPLISCDQVLPTALLQLWNREPFWMERQVRTFLIHPSNTYYENSILVVELCAGLQQRCPNIK